MDSQESLGGRSHARLQQAKERLGRGVVGILPGVGMCLHSGGLHVEIVGVTVIDRRRPLIGLERSEEGMLRILRHADPKAKGVVRAIKHVWHGFNLSEIRADAARQRMAQHN